MIRNNNNNVSQKMTNLAAPQEQDLVFEFKGYTVRRWTTRDREKAECVLRACWEEYGLPYEPELGEKHNIWVEDCYVRSEKGEFWVVMDEHSVLVGTAGYYEVSSTEKAVEIRKLYLLPEARGKKLGRALLEVGYKCLAMDAFSGETGPNFGPLLLNASRWKRKLTKFDLLIKTRTKTFLKVAGK